MFQRLRCTGDHSCLLNANLLVHCRLRWAEYSAEMLDKAEQQLDVATSLLTIQLRQLMLDLTFGLIDTRIHVHFVASHKQHRKVVSKQLEYSFHASDLHGTISCCGLMHRLYSLQNKSGCRPLLSLQAYEIEALCQVILVILSAF